MRNKAYRLEVPQQSSHFLFNLLMALTPLYKSTLINIWILLFFLTLPFNRL